MLVGQLITRTGAYRVFPIAGSVAATLGLLILAQLVTDTSSLWLAVGLTLLGGGLGAIIPVLTVAAQSAVTPRDIGVVTSTTSLARSLGSTIRATEFGLIWGLTLASESDGQPVGMPSVDAVAGASQNIFTAPAIIMAFAILLSVRLPQIHLRTIIDEA